jgi:hypothetical protein
MTAQQTTQTNSIFIVFMKISSKLAIQKATQHQHFKFIQ